MRLTPVVLGVVLVIAATPAFARFVDIEEVRAMAFNRGIVKLEEIELKRKKGIWKVEGEDARGREIEMKGLLNYQSFFCLPRGLYRVCWLRSAMAINGRRNKPFGPGGGTRRLHHQLTRLCRSPKTIAFR
jgi:hypothetical protein